MNNYWEPKPNAAISIRIHFGKSLRGDRQWKHPLTVHYKPLLICKSFVDVCFGEIRKYTLALRPIPSFIIYKLTKDLLLANYCLIGKRSVFVLHQHKQILGNGLSTMTAHVVPEGLICNLFQCIYMYVCVFNYSGATHPFNLFEHQFPCHLTIIWIYAIRRIESS